MHIESGEPMDQRDERLSLVMRATNDGIWDWDLQTNQVYFSPRWKEMLGYADDELGNTFDDWRRLVHPDDAPRAVTLIEDYLQGNASSYELEYRLQHRDGSYRWVLARGISLSDTSGKPYRMIGSHTDVTDRKRIEETLHARLAFERLITGISTEFVNLASDEIDNGILRALQAIGNFAQVDRSYVFLISSDGTTMDNTHEWCAPGIESFIAKLKAVPIATFPWLMEQLKQLRVVHVPSLDALPPEAAAEKREFDLQKIQSLINVPMVYRGALVGFLGLDSVLTAKTWSEDTIALLRIVGETFANALEHKREQALQAGQRQFLELLATGGDFSAMLHTLIRIVEEQWRGMLGLILLLDEDGQHLHIGGSVSLPKDYVDSIEGLQIGPLVGSCGTACYRRERVIVEDILTDPRWDGLRSLAVQHGLRACWSEPVIAKNGKVVGTFAMYYRQPRSPTQDELRTIATAAHLVGIAIEYKQAQEALRRSEERFRAVFEGAPIGIHVTSWDPQTTDWSRHTIESNRALQQILGYSEEELARMHLEEYSHQADAAGERALYREMLEGKRERYQIEKRYVAKDGRIFWGRYSASMVRSAHARPQMMIGMVENIDEQKQAQQALQVAYETLERRVQERTRELTALNAIAAVVSQSLQLKEIMSSALDKTMQVIGMEIGAAYRLETGAKSGEAMLRLVAHQGVSDELVRAADCFPLRNSAVEHAAGLRQPYVWKSEDVAPAGGLRSAFERAGLRLAITIPLMVKGELVGGMSIGTRQANSLTPESLDMLAAIGQQIGLAVENARFYQRERERHQEAERRRLVAEGMREIIAVLNSKQTLRDILDFIATQACRVLASDAAIIFRLQEKNGPLVIQSTFGLQDSHLGDLRFSIREGATWNALLERRPQFISDAAGARKPILEQQMPPNPERVWAMRMFDAYPGVLAVPLIVKGEDYGVLTLFYRAARAFSEEEINLASAVANQAALAIENARLHEQAQQSATTAERSRLARELHDSVTQSLYSVMLYAEAAARSLADKEIAEAGDFLKELRDTAQDALREMRLLIFELRPPTLEKDGLIGALRKRLNAVEGRGGMKTDLQVNDDRLAEQLPFSLQEALYHIVQEALNNVIRHAHAQSVRVGLQFSGNAIELRLSDDGIGFDPENASESSGLGLRGMRERVQRIGGSVEITSGPGKGTLVMVSVPFAVDSQEPTGGIE